VSIGCSRSVSVNGAVCCQGERQYSSVQHCIAWFLCNASRQRRVSPSACPDDIVPCRPPVDNISLLCASHGRVSHHNVTKMKRISEMAWAQLVSQVRNRNKSKAVRQYCPHVKCTTLHVWIGAQGGWRRAGLGKGRGHHYARQSAVTRMPARSPSPWRLHPIFCL